MTSPGPKDPKIKKVEKDPTAGGTGPDDHDCADKEYCQALDDIVESEKELGELTVKTDLEVIQVENKYNQLRKPSYDKRAGVTDKIRGFWMKVITNHPKIWRVVHEEEEPCLYYFMKKLEVEVFENMVNGFRVKFVFSTNPYFENRELIKEFHLGPDREPKSTSTTIKWIQMDLSKNQQQIIEERKKRGMEQRTFFSWFSDNKNPGEDDIAEAIRDEIWPDPMEFYPTPDKEDGDEEDGDEEDGDEEDGDEDNEDEEALDESEEEEDMEDMMDQDTRQEIEQCQKELDELNKKANVEVLQVHNKYNKLMKLCYDKRAAAIAKIPNFWADAMVNHPRISSLVYPDGEEEYCLNFLKKLEVEVFENMENGFRIKFVFDKNPYFHNQELVKEFNLAPYTEPESISTRIKWKKQMDLSKNKGKNLGKSRGLKNMTFFSWFSDNKNPTEDDIAAKVIKEDLWPDALSYYLKSRELEDEEDSDEDDEEWEDMMEEEDDDSNAKNGDGVGNGEKEDAEDDDDEQVSVE